MNTNLFVLLGNLGCIFIAIKHTHYPSEFTCILLQPYASATVNITSERQLSSKELGIESAITVEIVDYEDTKIQSSSCLKNIFNPSYRPLIVTCKRNLGYECDCTVCRLQKFKILRCPCSNCR